MKTIKTEKYNIHVGKEALEKLHDALSASSYSQVFVLVDEHTKKHCLPAIKKALSIKRYTIIQIKSGEKNKNLSSCERIWKVLSKENADRKSLLLNLGGGVVTDMGAFAASTYKRGIDFINIPTTLLAQVDASVGGKTGIDFLNFKNQIGTFSFSNTVIVFPNFLRTLPKRELLSGFAEVVKHGLIADKKYWKQIQKNPLDKLIPNKTGYAIDLENLIVSSIQIKNKIVQKDPFEKDIRKSLNFGHTIGHAIESASLKTKKKLLHGEAIAIGMICEAYLSRKYCGLPNNELATITEFISSTFSCKEVKFSIKKLVGLMQQDKKNSDSEINFTLLSTIGKTKINNSCSEDLIEESIYYYNSTCK